MVTIKVCLCYVDLDVFKSKTCRHLCKLWRTMPLDPNASFAVQTDRIDDDSCFSDHSPLRAPTSFQTMTPSQTYPVMPFLYPGKRLLVRG